MESHLIAIKEHLQTLGYDDVPEDVLEELADELYASGFMPSQQQQQQPVVEERQRPPEFKRTLNREAIMEQLKLLGYDEDSVPPDVLDELIEELNETLSIAHNRPQTETAEEEEREYQINESSYTTAATDIESETMDDSIVETDEPSPPPPLRQQLSFDSVRRTVQEQKSRHDLLARPVTIAEEEEEEHVQEETDENENGDDDIIKRMGNRENWNRQSTSSNRSSAVLTSAAMQYQMGIPFSVGLAKRKKSDPLKLYQKFKSQWDNDVFLQRSNPSSTKSKERMFNGIGYHALMGGNQVQVSRRGSTVSNSSATSSSSSSYRRA